MVSNQSGSDVRLLRHNLDDGERPLAATVIRGLPKQLRLARDNTVRLEGSSLAGAIERLLTLLSRPQTAALFVMDGDEHLTARQISALRRRASKPSDYPKLRVGALRDTRPEPKPRPDGQRAPARPVQCERFRVKTIARYLLDIRPETDQVKRKPILETLALDRCEMAEAEALSVALLSARFAQAGGKDPTMIAQSILYAMLDLMTLLARGSTAYVLVLDHDHLADAAKPRWLDKYTHAARTLTSPSARTLYMKRTKAERVARARVV